MTGCPIHCVNSFGAIHYAQHPALAMNDECTCSANFMPKKFGKVNEKSVARGGGGGASAAAGGGGGAASAAPGATAAAGAPLEERQRELMMGRAAFQEEIATLQKKKEIEQIEDVVYERIQELHSLHDHVKDMKYEKETENHRFFAPKVDKLKNEVEIINRKISELKKKLKIKKQEEDTLLTERNEAFDVLVEGENGLLEEIYEEISDLSVTHMDEEQSQDYAQPR